MKNSIRLLIAVFFLLSGAGKTTAQVPATRVYDGEKLAKVKARIFIQCLHGVTDCFLVQSIRLEKIRVTQQAVFPEALFASFDILVPFDFIR